MTWSTVFKNRRHRYTVPTNYRYAFNKADHNNFIEKLLKLNKLSTEILFLNSHSLHDLNCRKNIVNYRYKKNYIN